MSELHHDPACKDTMDELLLVIPGVKPGSAMGHPGYKVNGKLFAFVGIHGVVALFEEAVVYAASR